MFSFHKPRVYRSTEGCCICKAKSSSSRFTDSKKYEKDSLKCFDLKEPRKGEICNACVLLVKRYKRLPTGSNRHWGHVVDARAGPGMKSMSKFKKHRDEPSPHASSADPITSHKSLIVEKFSKIFRKNKNKTTKLKTIPQTLPLMVESTKQWEGESLPLTPESGDSDCEEIGFSPVMPQPSPTDTQISASIGSNRRKRLRPLKYRNADLSKTKFYDEQIWKKRRTCCGIAFRHDDLGAMLFDIENYHPCAEHKQKTIQTTPMSTKESTCLSVPQTHNERILIPSTSPAIEQPPTPVLKKHHLFYKRQSESFPTSDLITTSPTTINNAPKTVENKVCLPNNVATSSVSIAKLSPLEINLQTIEPKPVSRVALQEQQNTNKPLLNNKLLIKKTNLNSGKILKHTFDKVNTLRLKPSELAEVKQFIKTADKSLVVKPTLIDKTLKKSPTAEISPNGLSQPVAPKFNDNSSDSGFDENMQDRKSVSPLQDEPDKKPLALPVQTMYISNSVYIPGQNQNLFYSGEDINAKMFQNRRLLKDRNPVRTVQIPTVNPTVSRLRAINSHINEAPVIANSPITSSKSQNIIPIPSTSYPTHPVNHLNKPHGVNIILNGSTGRAASSMNHLSKLHGNGPTAGVAKQFPKPLGSVILNGLNDNGGSPVVNSLDKQHGNIIVRGPISKGTKSHPNIILNNAGNNVSLISSTVPNVNQKIILLKAKCGNLVNNQ